jgi:hypothetical protein
MINSDANQMIVIFYDDVRTNALPGTHGDPAMRINKQGTQNLISARP